VFKVELISVLLIIWVEFRIKLSPFIFGLFAATQENALGILHVNGKFKGVPEQIEPIAGLVIVGIGLIVIEISSVVGQAPKFVSKVVETV